MKREKFKRSVLGYAIILSLLIGLVFTLTACIKPQEGEVFTVKYIASEGGYIDGDSVQTIEYGKNAATVTAKPLEGYEFTGWSDDFPTAQRSDEDVKATISVTANFVKKVFNLTYTTSTGGTIGGDKNQVVPYGNNAETVTAIPSEGYVFTGWSDGYTQTERTDAEIKCELTVTAYFEKQTFGVQYTASEGGYIDGDIKQTIQYDEDAETITARPHEGYYFVKWSDTDSTNLARTDENVTAEINATAEFEQISKTFTYIYNNATENNSDENVKITYQNMFDAPFAVPAREFFTFDGWYLEPEFITKVADGNGNLLINYGIFDTDSNYLYAKWMAKEKIIYPILMVFVTEVDATLSLDEFLSGPKVDVYYKMSDAERQFCELIPGQIEKTLNETFDGLMVFNVDFYFTTMAIDESSFSHTNATLREFYVMANDIPEVGPMLKNYRSVITTIHFNGHNIPSYDAMGRGTEKYAFVYLDTFIRTFRNSGKTLKDLNDLSNPSWRFVIYIYLHEFTHTVEQSSSIREHRGADYHSVLSSYTNTDELELTKLYLLNRAKVNGVNGERGGIPYFFWKGEIEVYVRYAAGFVGISLGGYVNERSVVGFNVPFGGTASEVTAVAKNGYRFVKWSDGVTAATRQDTNIISRLEVTAIFEKI